MFRHLLVKACQILVGSADGLSEAVGHTPKDPEDDHVYQLEKNVAWGKDWIHERLEEFHTGRPIRITPSEWVMLVAFAASVLLLRRGSVPNGTAVVGKLVSSLAT